MADRPAGDLGGQLARHRDAYIAWLATQPLAANTRRTYATRVGQYLAWLEGYSCEAGDPLVDSHARTYAVRDYKRHLARHRKLATATINLTLAALDHFSRYLGLAPAEVRREELPSLAPKALTEDDQRRFLRAVERAATPRDAAICLLALYAALRLSELHALDVDDLAISARKGQATIRTSKGEIGRQVPLNAEVRRAVEAWQAHRTELDPNTTALFVSHRGRRLSTRAIDQAIRKIAAEAGLDLSSHVLRHTCLTRLVRSGVDLVTVAEIAGHRRLETTRAYTLPSQADRQEAMEGLHLDY